MLDWIGGTEEPKSTRRRILEAAVEVFAGKGYHEARVDEIVEASQTSKGAVYSYFPSKERIFLALVDEFAGLLEKQLEEAMAGEESGIRRVDAALRTCLDTFGRYRKLAKIFLVQAAGLGTAFEEKRLQVHDRFAGLIKSHLDRAVAEGDIPPLDTQVAAYAWMGAIYEVVIRWVYSGQPAPDQVLPTLRTMLLRSIGVSEERIRQLDDGPQAVDQ
ncbi:MAG: TetR/AcrR family transcriptional regulator [Chloroflexi bacterium]|nr:MAG: TetR/AcrR family transcriptional regulator [Chloroflexota bacterium]